MHEKTRYLKNRSLVSWYLLIEFTAAASTQTSQFYNNHEPLPPDSVTFYITWSWISIKNNQRHDSLFCCLLFLTSPGCHFTTSNRLSKLHLTSPYLTSLQYTRQAQLKTVSWSIEYTQFLSMVVFCLPHVLLLKSIVICDAVQVVKVEKSDWGRVTVAFHIIIYIVREWSSTENNRMSISLLFTMYVSDFNHCIVNDISNYHDGKNRTTG